jgi:hypothetical protein
LAGNDDPSDDTSCAAPAENPLNVTRQQMKKFSNLALPELLIGFPALNGKPLHLGKP